jgi:hypothetical protein
VARESAPGVVLLVYKRRRGLISQENLLVLRTYVRGRGHVVDSGRIDSWRRWWDSRERKEWICSGLRVLAAHDQVRWDLRLVVVGGRH